MKPRILIVDDEQSMCDLLETDLRLRDFPPRCFTSARSSPTKDAVEAAWAVVEPVLSTHHRTRPYNHRTRGPKEADALIAADGRWHNPRAEEV